MPMLSVTDRFVCFRLIWCIRVGIRYKWNVLITTRSIGILGFDISMRPHHCRNTHSRIDRSSLLADICIHSIIFTIKMTTIIMHAIAFDIKHTINVVECFDAVSPVSHITRVGSVWNQGNRHTQLVNIWKCKWKNLLWLVENPSLSLFSASRRQYFRLLWFANEARVPSM